jgi:glycosyltransferase involved in cell wall biosynthesis
VQAVHVNGKWLAQKLTGTQRYAGEIVQAIVAAGCFDMVLHVPADARVPDWADAPCVTVRRSRFTGVVFEQVYLPVAAAGKLLLNFAGPAPMLKRRQLVTMHDATPFRYPRTYRRTFVAFYFAMYGLLGRTAEILSTVSHFSASELSRALHISGERFLVAGCAADALHAISPTRPDLDLKGDEYLVVGTQAQHKNLAGPLAAIAASGRNVVVVGVAGSQQVFSSMPALERTAVICGRLTDAELAWLYRNCRGLIFPSKYEGFGLPPLEAQTLGCPVVCSQAASLPEVCGDGALYFDPDDTESLVAQLDRLESEAGLADVMRNRGLANSRRYSWNASAQQVIERVCRGAS